MIDARTHHRAVVRKIVDALDDALKTVAYYDKSLNRAVLDFYRGEMESGEFIDKMISLIEGQLTRAWNEGMRDNDLDPQKDMKPEWEDILQKEIDAEFEHVLDFAQAVEDARTAGNPVGPLQDRVELWTARYNDVLSLSRVTTRPEDRFKWVFGDTQHCGTCAALNGIVATGKDWLASGYRPQNPPNDKLECGGWHCQCSLEQTDEPLTEGGIQV